MSNQDQSSLLLSILRPDFERPLQPDRVRIFRINPSGATTIDAGFARNQPELEYIFESVAAQLGLTTGEYRGDIEEVTAPPKGFGYLLEITNLDGTTIVDATFHETRIVELSEADLALAKRYLNRLIEEWHLSENLVLA